MKIYLVAGKAGSGKGEVAKFIKEYEIYQKKNCAITSYSKYLKSFTKELTDWDGNDVTKPRGFMQEIGDKIRAINPDYFTSNMISDVMIYENLVDTLVIADVRLPEEINRIKDNFADVYAIYVVNQFGNSNLTIEEQMHKTETALEDYSDFDYVLANDTLVELRKKVFKIMEETSE